MSEDGSSEPESFLGSLFALLALMLVVGLGVALFGLRVQNADSRELFGEVLVEDPVMPYGFELVGGTAVAGKQRWIRFERPEGSEPTTAAGAVIPEVVLFGPSSVSSRPPACRAATRSRASSVSGRRTRRRPSSACSSAARSSSDRSRRTTCGCASSSTRALDTGEFYDLIRIDLTLPDAAQLLVAHWPLGSEASEVDTLLPFFDVIRLPDPSELAAE
ncbi:MAG: hypothetical protein ACYTFV_15930 [Planctomycetota bacterium]